MRPLRAVVVLLLLAAVGCGGSTEVGSAVDTRKLTEEQRRLGEVSLPEDEGGGGGSLALGEEDDQGEADQQQQDEADQQAREEEVAKAREQAAIEFFITQSGYNPYYIRIFKGGTIKVTNQDVQARTMTADKGEFDSGPIAPGESWVGGPFDELGKFNFHDGTRPYVVGTLEVLPR